MLRAGNQSDVDRLYSAFWNREEAFFTWGSEELDLLLPNITRGQLVVLAASQGAGKTTWSIEMAKQNAIKGRTEKYKVGYLSLEMDPERIIKRATERCLAINKEDRRRGLIFDSEGLSELQARSRTEIKAFVDTGLWIFSDLEKSREELSTLPAINAICEAENGPALLFIDNLAEIEAPQIRDEYMRTDYIMRELHDMTRRTNVTIVLLHHMAKGKAGDRLTVNSVKGNNIVVTKPDTVVAIDRHDITNPNWSCFWRDAKDGVVDVTTRNKFLSLGPKIEVREIQIFKDRDYAMCGSVGYMRLVDGVIELLNKETLKTEYPLLLLQQDKLRATLDRYNLLPAHGNETVTNNEFLPWD